MIFCSILVYPPRPSIGSLEIRMEDLKCLDERQWLNETIIYFYLQYVHRELVDKRKQNKIFIFNTYFYYKLVGTPQMSFEERYLSVKNWTRDVPLLSKNYLVIPIHQRFFFYIIN